LKGATQLRSQTITAPDVAVRPISATFPGRDLVSIRDLSPIEVESLFHLAMLAKARPEDFRSALAGKHIAMFFEKPSLRTRLTFESGIFSLGGSVSFVDQRHERLDARETLADIAHNLERWVSAIVLRTFAHETVEGMAEHACVPVINALSEVEHPCQALADYFTLHERYGNLKRVCLTYVGDGNNVMHSLLLTAALLGSEIRIATPEAYGPNPGILADAREIAKQTGAVIELMTDPHKAVRGAHAVYTDAWTSMGHEHETEERARIFPPYQVNAKLMANAAPHAVFMHCLPAHRNEEVTDAVIDSVQSIVFDQAENRMHVQKAILMMLVGGKNRQPISQQIPTRSAHA
jgi:ornithine carbamoyltransferase